MAMLPHPAVAAPASIVAAQISIVIKFFLAYSTTTVQAKVVGCLPCSRDTTKQLSLSTIVKPVCLSSQR